MCPIIGSDQHQQFNQLEISDIIEARMEEIFELIIAELNRIGVQRCTRWVCIDWRSSEYTRNFRDCSNHIAKSSSNC